MFKVFLTKFALWIVCLSGAIHGAQFSQKFKHSKLQKVSFTTYLGLLKTLGRINLECLNKSKSWIMAIEFIIYPSLNILKF